MRRYQSPFWRSVRNILYIIGTLFLVTGIAMVLPIICALFYYGEGDLLPLGISAGISLSLGAVMRVLFFGDVKLEARDALFIATFGWVFVSSISALPFMLHGAIPNFTDAFFEMMSGYTTTGATILNDIEALPPGLLMWRSETHFMGGMGFVTFAVLLLPHGMGGARLFKAESSPGQVLTGERFVARNRDAVVSLWIIYSVLNLVQIILYMFGGMSLFDSICHAFGTVSTSGYSTYNASVGHFNSPYFDWVTTIFMFLGGVSFGLFYSFYKKDWNTVWINTELKWYSLIVLFFSLVISLLIWGHADGYGFGDSLRHGFFQTVSILTTTGFSTVDYETWPQAAQMFLVVVCFIGASAGSTTSGIKIMHYVLIWKFMVSVIRKVFLQPLSVISVRVNQKKVDMMVIYVAICYFIVNIFMVLLGGCVLVLTDDIDFASAMSATVAALMNIGPGFGAVGPSHNFAFFSDTAKWFLSLNMLVGRLEMFSALALLYPTFWRR